MVGETRRFTAHTPSDRPETGLFGHDCDWRSMALAHFELYKIYKRAGLAPYGKTSPRLVSPERLICCRFTGCTGVQWSRAGGSDVMAITAIFPLGDRGFPSRQKTDFVRTNGRRPIDRMSVVLFPAAATLRPDVIIHQ